MKKICIIIGLVSAIICAVLAVLPVFKLAIFPGILGLICAIIAIIKAKKELTSTQVIQLIFIIIILAFSLSIYKTIFTTIEVGNTDELEQREDKKKEEAKEELLDIEITE